MTNEELQTNRILARLPGQERDLLLPSCEIVQLNLGEILDEAGEPVRFLHFPLTAAISVTAMEGHQHMVEVTLTGKEGASGSSVVQGADKSMCTAMIQIPGTAIRVLTAAVLDQLEGLPYFKAALSRYNLLLLRHAVISVGCGRYHSVSQRLARWLTAHWHRTGIESFPFSAQFLSAQVGIEDPQIVAGVLEEFQSHGMVKTGRNNVTITNHEALGKQVCECFALAKKAIDEYLSDLEAIAGTHANS